MINSQNQPFRSIEPVTFYLHNYYQHCWNEQIRSIPKYIIRHFNRGAEHTDKRGSSAHESQQNTNGLQRRAYDEHHIVGYFVRLLTSSLYHGGNRLHADKHEIRQEIAKTNPPEKKHAGLPTETGNVMRLEVTHPRPLLTQKSLLFTSAADSTELVDGLVCRALFKPRI
ncbi:hypothetical protein ACTID9_05070 [Brevibacillus fluminis]|uniref:hypothetical protein n=1 Tax=Brevibacillus fluminis TaxID=511487 RepID=UPI003F8B5354